MYFLPVDKIIPPDLVHKLAEEMARKTEAAIVAAMGIPAHIVLDGCTSYSSSPAGPTGAAKYAKAQGLDFHEVANELGEEKKYLESLGLPGTIAEYARAVDRRIRVQVETYTIALRLPPWIIHNRQRLAGHLWLAGAAFDQNLRAMAAIHGLPTRQ